jgi:predicted N-acyltransferase
MTGTGFPEASVMAAIWDVADRQGLSWIIFKDFSAADLAATFPAASTAPFFSVPSFPYATLDLADVGSFDDYLAQLKGKARRNARRKMRKFAAHPDLTLEIRQDWADVVPEMVHLYEQVLGQADMRLDHLEASFFSAVAGSTLDAQVILVRLDDRLVGFLLCLLSSSHCIDLRAGLDYDVSREHSLWFVLHYESVRLAADRGCRQVEFLQSTYHAKQEVGCCLRPLVHQVTHRRPRARALLRHALPPAAAKTVRDTVATT